MQNQVKKRVMKSVMTQLSNSSCCDPTQMITSICWQCTHTKQSLHMAWTWCWGAVFFRLTKADPKWCLLLLLLTNFTIDITKSCMHAKKRGRKTPKHAWMFPCCYSPFTLRAQISDYLQMTDMQHLEIPLSALNFGKPKVNQTSSKAGMWFGKTRSKPEVFAINQHPQ